MWKRRQIFSNSLYRDNFQEVLLTLFELLVTRICLLYSGNLSEWNSTFSQAHTSFLSISIKRKVACSEGCETVVDTGTSAIEGTSTLVNNI